MQILVLQIRYGTWNIVGSTARSHTVIPNGNTITVYYTRTQASTYVQITYVNKDNDQEILYEETGTTLLYIGQTHSYTVPGSLPDANGGLWAPVDTTPGVYNHLVTASDNHIIIPCEKLMTDVTINYVDYEDNGNIIYTDTISVQVGINYTYENAPEKYVDPAIGDHWELIPQQDMSIVIDADGKNNVINIQYLKLASTAKVTVTGQWNNVSESTEVIVIITNLITGRQYHGLLKTGQNESSIFKYLPLGTYSISCMDQLNMSFIESDSNGNIFVIEDYEDDIEIEVTNERRYPNGFHSIDSANNPMKVYIE